MSSINQHIDEPPVTAHEPAILPPSLRHDEASPLPRYSPTPHSHESKEEQPPNPSPSLLAPPTIPSPPRLPQRRFEGRSYVDAPPVPFFFHPPPPAASPATTRSTVSGSRRPSLAAGNVPSQHHIAQLSALPAHERTSSILRSLFCHHLPSLISPRPIRRSFVRTTDTVIRATLAFVVAAVIAVQPWSTDVLAIPYLFAMFTAGTVRPTVGSTVFYIDSQGKGVLAAAVVDVLITAAQIQQLTSTPRIVVSEALLFITSVLLAYYFHTPLSRRFSLACHTLILISIANGNTQIYLPFQIFLCFLLSYFISFVLVLIPFPRLAKDELLDRYQQSLAVLSTVFVEVIASYLNTEPIAPVVWSVTATSQLDAVSKSLTEMRRLKSETEFESDIWLWLFPKSISVACPIKADVDKIEQLYWILSNLLHTLTQLKFSTAHAAFVHFLRESLSSLASEQQLFLGLMSHEKTDRVTVERVADHKRRLERCMQDCWRDYGIAREHVYGSKEESQVRKSTHQHISGHARRLSLSRVDALRTASMQAQSPMDGTTSAEATLSRKHASSEVDEYMRQTDPLLAAAVIHPTSSSLYHTTHDVFARSCFFFYVTRFHTALQTMQINQPDPHTAATPPITPSAAASASSTARTTKYHAIKRAAFTAAQLTSDTEGALWQRSMHRLLGTLVGGLVGYLIILAFPDTWYASILLLTVWCIPMLFVQFSAYSYLGSLAQFTPIVITFGYKLTANGSDLTPERYALARMEEIVIGVAIALCISTVLWPVSSVRLLRSEMVVSIESFKAGINRTISVYEQMAMRQERRVKERTARRNNTSSQLLQTSSSKHMTTGSNSNMHTSSTLPHHNTSADDPTKPVNGAVAIDVDLNLNSGGMQPPLTGREVSQQIEKEIAEQNAALQSLFSTANSVQLSLARQYTLLSEAVNEPTFFFAPFPSAQYSLITRTERRIWSLILTIEPALEQILEQHKRALEDDGRGGYGRLSELEEEEAMFDVSAIRSDIQLMSNEMSTLLTSSAQQLQSGQTEQSQQLEAVVCIVQAVEAAFATSMNEMAARVREGQGRLLRSEQIVPIAVFLYSAAQLAEQVLVLDSAVRRLLELEQPTTYDD